MAVSAEILSEAAASTQAGRVLADDEQAAPADESLRAQQPSSQAPSGGQLAGHSGGQDADGQSGSQCLGGHSDGQHADGQRFGSHPDGQRFGSHPDGQRFGSQHADGQHAGSQHSDGQHSVGQQLVGQQMTLAETLRAGAIFFEVAVESLSRHATSDPALLPSFATCVSALNESINKRIRRATAAYTRQLVEHIHRAQLDERRRIARELHDRLGEGLSVAYRQLELLEIFDTQQPPVSQRNAPVKDAILETMNRLRAITSDLRAEPVTSLEKALTRHLDSMVADADVRLRISGEEKWATPAVLDQVFLVLREALRNALSHAEPRLVKVAVDFSPETLRASVHDDGCGFVPRDVERHHPATAGLASMRERTALVGGMLTISSAPARGTYVDLYVPLSGHCAKPSP